MPTAVGFAFTSHVLLPDGEIRLVVVGAHRLGRSVVRLPSDMTEDDALGRHRE
jgi:hypothetical protein